MVLFWRLTVQVVLSYYLTALRNVILCHLMLIKTFSKYWECHCIYFFYSSPIKICMDRWEWGQISSFLYWLYYEETTCSSLNNLRNQWNCCYLFQRILLVCKKLQMNETNRSVMMNFMDRIFNDDDSTNIGKMEGLINTVSYHINFCFSRHNVYCMMNHFDDWTFINMDMRYQSGNVVLYASIQYNNDWV